MEHKIALTDILQVFKKKFMGLQQNGRHYKFYTMNETCFLGSFHLVENYVSPISDGAHTSLIYLIAGFI